MQSGSSSSSPTDIDLMKPAVHQLWDAFQGILTFGTNLMQPFLKVFDSEVGNGLSPFAVDIETPGFVKVMHVLGSSVKYSLNSLFMIQ